MAPAVFNHFNINGFYRNVDFSLLDIRKPDFAYPRDVIRDADAALAQAVKAGDAPVQLLALMQKTKAAESIDADSLKTSIAEVMRYGARLKTPDAKAMFNLYAAELYNKYRMDNHWNMRGRTLPEGPRPADIAEWDGKAFIEVVDSLLAEAWKIADDTSLEQWSKAVKADRLTRTYYPAVCDFVASKILEGGLVHSTPLITDVRRHILAKHSEGSASWMLWTSKLTAQFTPGDNAKAMLELWTKYRANPNSEIIAYTILTTYLDLNKNSEIKATWTRSKTSLKAYRARGSSLTPRTLSPTSPSRASRYIPYKKSA